MNENFKKSKNHINGLSVHLPTDEQAERAVIAATLAMPNIMADLVSILAGGAVFSHEGYALIFSAMTDLYASGKVLRVAAIVQRIKAQGHYEKLTSYGISLIELPVEAYAADARETALYLRGLWTKRISAESSLAVLHAVSSSRTVEEVIDMVVAAADTISTGISAGSERRIGEVLSDALGRIDHAVSHPDQLTGVDTGLQKINRHTGGWQNTDVIMIAGRPGSGKTVSGLFHAEAAAKNGIPVAYLSLEMPARSLINRLLSARTQIPYSDIKKGRINREQLAQIHQAAGELERLPIYFYDEPGKDVNDLMYLLLAWKKKYKIGLVIIDYVQLMTDRTVYAKTEYAVLTSVSVRLKELQRRLNCPLIELAQLSRAVETRTDRRPGLSDLRSTGQFEQDASVVIGLYRDDYYKDEAARKHALDTGDPYIDPIMDNELEYVILKDRDGFTGVAKLWCDVATNRIFDQAPIEADASWYQPQPTSPF